MLTTLKLDSANALGFVASGEVSAGDYESVLIPAVEDLLRLHKKIRLLYHLGPEFIGFTAGAMWDDAKIGLKHIGAWEKIALVTDIEWLRKSAPLIAITVPGEVKVFSNAELDAAILWLQE